MYRFALTAFMIAALGGCKSPESTLVVPENEGEQQQATAGEEVPPETDEPADSAVESAAEPAAASATESSTPAPPETPHGAGYVPCIQECDDVRPATDRATCELSCEQKHKGDQASPGELTIRMFRVCVEECAPDRKPSDVKTCRLTCEGNALSRLFPKGSDDSKRSCAKSCFETGLQCVADSEANNDETGLLMCEQNGRRCVDKCE